MAFHLAVGTLVQIASAYGSSKSMTAISNAAAAVGTLEASHGIIVGDYFEVTSGWSLLDGRVVRASVVATNDVTLEGVVSTSTSNYPAGSGTGSIREISTWTTVTQIAANIGFSGGDQQFGNITTLQDRTQRQIPTVRSPVQVTLPLYYDEALSWVATVRSVTDSATATAVRFVFPDGSRMVGNAYWNMADTPTIEDGTLRSQITLAFAAKPINYAT